jgi:hypothetical protein
VSGDYLWDGSGEPDPEIRRLEEALRPLRGRRQPPELPERAATTGAALSGWGGLAAAAAVLLACAALLSRGPGAREGWDLAWLDGERGGRPARLAVGDWMETGGSRARLAVGDIGEVRLEPSTRVGLVDAGRRSHRLSLARGGMRAVIWAPPGRFLVDTPSATAVDLGCEYTLHVDGRGDGLLRVETGWVGIEDRGRLALVPAGAACAMRRGVGPGTPSYETAPASLRAALETVDFGPPGERAAALATVLADARERDAFSLWHLLSRLDGEDRGRVFDRLATLVPPPAGVTRDGVLRGERAMVDAWWDELGLGSSEFWRDWTGEWSEPPAAAAGAYDRGR